MRKVLLGLLAVWIVFVVILGVFRTETERDLSGEVVWQDVCLNLFIGSTCIETSETSQFMLQFIGVRHHNVTIYPVRGNNDLPVEK